VVPDDDMTLVRPEGDFTSLRSEAHGGDAGRVLGEVLEASLEVLSCG
jgi:hypothetical protein